MRKARVSAQHRGALVRPPRRPQHAQHGDVGGGIGQHVGRVAHQDAALGRRRHVDMLVAHREGRDHPHRGRQLADGVGIQGIARSAHDAVEALGRFDQRRAVIQLVLGVEPGIEIGRQPRLDVGREVPRGEHARFAVCHGWNSPCAALTQAMFLEIGGYGYYA